MFGQLFGKYLVKKGLLTEDEYRDAIQKHLSVRVPIGTIAIAEGLLTEAQVEEIHRQQKQFDKLFGDIAVEKGYMTEVCLTSDPDSVKTFVPWLEYFRKIDFPVHYLLIKNEKDGELFFTSETLLEPIIQKLKLPHTVFVFPAIEQEYINSLNNHGVPLREHYLGNAPDILNTIMQRSRMRNHYYSITDPIVMFYAQRMEKVPETPAYLHAKRRTALRKGEIRDKRYTKEEYNPKTEKGN